MSLKLEILEGQFMAKAFFIDSFQQSGPDRFVHFNCRADDLFSEIFITKLLYRASGSLSTHCASNMDLLLPRVLRASVSPW